LDDQARTIEAAYLKSSFVGEICVFDLDEPGSEDRAGVRAVVVPNLELIRRKRIANIGDLLRFEMEGQSIHLPANIRVGAYEIWFEALPRTSAGEVDRDAIRRRVSARRGAKALLAGEPIGRDANLEIDLGLDSIDRVALFAELERRHGIRLPAERAHEILTVGQVLDAFGLTDERVWQSPLGDAWRLLLNEDPATDKGEPDIAWALKEGGAGAATLWVAARLARAIMPRMIVAGRERLPGHGPYILCPNHQSYLDPFFVISTLPYRLVRQMFAVGAAEYFENAAAAWLSRQFKLVPVDPDANLVGAMQAAARGLRHGKILVLFPEGERSIDGRVKRFKKGAAILSRQLNVPVVPVAIRGVFDVWPRNRPVNWRSVVPWARHHVGIAFGEPLRFPEAATIAEATALLQRQVEELYDALPEPWREREGARHGTGEENSELDASGHGK
jgi:long-chain acyl-CoA synthetase